MLNVPHFYLYSCTLSLFQEMNALVLDLGVLALRTMHEIFGM